MWMKTHPNVVTVEMHDGGLQRLDMAGWYGCVYSLPRAALAALRDREELRRPGGYGVYVLWRAARKGSHAKAHVGSGWVRTRLRKHARDLDFWDQCTVLVTPAYPMSRDVAQDLEARFIEHGRRAPTWTLVNTNRVSRPHLSRFHRTEAARHVNGFRACLRLLGVDFDEPAGNPFGDTYLYLEGKGIRAKGLFTPSGITVCPGSQMVGKEKLVDSFPKTLKKERTRLRKKNIIKKEGNIWVFVKPWPTSLSTAAKILEGRSVNGRDAWKDGGGLSPNAWMP